MSFKCLYTNAQSICNKFDEFKSCIFHHHPKIIAITESWCNEAVSDSEISLVDYKIYRKDKQSGCGGGVLLYIHCSLNFTLCDYLNDLYIMDSLWGTIELTPNETLLVGVVYRSPSSNNCNNDKLNQAVQRIHQCCKFTQLLLMGDFNYPGINWSLLSAAGNNSTPAAAFLDSCEDAYLVQHVRDFTRSRGNQRPSLLDLVFTCSPEAIDNISHLAPLGCSDHDILLWDYLCLYQPAPKTFSCSWNYFRGNYEEFNNYFHQMDWSELFNNDIEYNWSVLKEHMHRAQELFIPRVMRRARSNKLPWWSKQVEAAVIDKQRAFKRFKNTNSTADYDNYKVYRNKAKNAMRQARLNYESCLIANIKSRPHSFYSYIRSKKKVKDHIEYLIRPDGTKTKNYAESAEVLAQFFSSVYTVESMTNVPDFPSRSHNQINSLVIAEEDLLRRLSQLNTSKAMGPDGIHTWLLKEGRYGLCKPLAMLYNLSLKCGKLPQDWKQALCYTNI